MGDREKQCFRGSETGAVSIIIMKKNLLIILGSPRLNGNSSLIARELEKGFLSSEEAEARTIRAGELNIQPCTGCLKCNKTGKCESHRDGWEDFLSHFKKASHIVIASPVYFHHLPGELKILLDRFRSQIQIKMTESGLIHIPRWVMKKQYAFIFTLGDRSDHDALPAIKILSFVARLFGATEENISVLVGRGLAIRRQVTLSQNRLENLYEKLELPQKLATEDYRFNRNLLQQAYKLGASWAGGLHAE